MSKKSSSPTYRRILPSFWVKWAKILKESDAISTALYLKTAPSSNMLGIYYIPIWYIAGHLQSSVEAVTKGLERCIAVDFCSYDFENEIVWIHDFAYEEFDGITLKSTDNRAKGSQTIFNNLPKTCFFLKQFYEKYGDLLALQPIPPWKPLRSSLEAPSKPLPSQEQDHDQDHNIKNDDFFKNSESETVDNSLFAKQARWLTEFKENWITVEEGGKFVNFGYETTVLHNQKIITEEIKNLALAALDLQKPEYQLKLKHWTAPGFRPEFRAPTTWFADEAWMDRILTEEEIIALKRPSRDEQKKAIEEAAKKLDINKRERWAAQLLEKIRTQAAEAWHQLLNEVSKKGGFEKVTINDIYAFDKKIYYSTIGIFDRLKKHDNPWDSTELQNEFIEVYKKSRAQEANIDVK